MTLAAFMASGLRNAWVSEPGFSALYVRKAHGLLRGSLVDTLDLASMEASRPGAGALTRLVERLRADYPARVLFVESVLNERLPRKLLALGFERVPVTEPPCFSDALRPRLRSLPRLPQFLLPD